MHGKSVYDDVLGQNGSDGGLPVGAARMFDLIFCSGFNVNIPITKAKLIDESVIRMRENIRV